MRDAYFDVPLMGEVRRLVSVSQAAVFLMEGWPEAHGARYRAALRACTGRLASPNDIANARRSFLAAAKEADLIAKDEHEDDDLTPQHADDVKAPSLTEEKRRNRGRMEEKEEFLVRFLARETGITEAQARDLINMIGIDRSSLLREARKLESATLSVGFS
jgi:Protein of unknown function (DUF982)